MLIKNSEKNQNLWLQNWLYVHVFKIYSIPEQNQNHIKKKQERKLYYFLQG